MVDDDDVGAERARGGQRLEAGGAAVDRDDQAGAVARQALDGVAAGAVALRHAVGDVDARGEPVRGEEAMHERGRAGAVDVVVAEHDDRLLALDRVGEARGAFVHVTHGAGIGHQRLDGRVEENGHVGQTDAARGEHAAQQLWQVMALADGDCGLGGGGVEALAPGEPARGGRHAEIGPARPLGLGRNDLAYRPHPLPRRLLA